MLSIGTGRSVARVVSPLARRSITSTLSFFSINFTSYNSSSPRMTASTTGPAFAFDIVLYPPFESPEQLDC